MKVCKRMFCHFLKSLLWLFSQLVVQNIPRNINCIEVFNVNYLFPLKKSFFIVIWHEIWVVTAVQKYLHDAKQWISIIQQNKMFKRLELVRENLDSICLMSFVVSRASCIFPTWPIFLLCHRQVMWGQVKSH